MLPLEASAPHVVRWRMLSAGIPVIEENAMQQRRLIGYDPNKQMIQEQLEFRLENYVTYGIEEVLDLQAYLADFGCKLIWRVVPARDEDL
jgi:hypothetical protein